MEKPRITEGEAEKIVDRIVQGKLHTDVRYLHAENAEAQAWAEDDIAVRAWAEVEDRYTITPA